MNSTTSIKQTQSKTWLAYGSFLDVKYIASGSTRGEALEQAAKLKERIFDKQLAPKYNYL